MPVPSAPRRPCCPGSASSTATAIPTGRAMTSAMALVTTVPKMNGSAPKVFVTWFQSWPIRKPTPNLVTDGQACWIKTATTRIREAGAAQLMNAVTVRYRSGGRGAGATESAELSTATANVTPSRWAGDRFRRAADQVSWVGLAVEAVSDPSHGHDLKRGPRCELLAQPADMNIDRLAIAGELAAPHVLQQRVARGNASRYEIRSNSRAVTLTSAPSRITRRAARLMLKAPIESCSGIDFGSLASGCARRSTACTRARTSRIEKGLVM